MLDITEEAWKCGPIAVRMVPFMRRCAAAPALTSVCAVCVWQSVTAVKRQSAVDKAHHLKVYLEYVAFESGIRAQVCACARLRPPELCG